MPDLFKVTLGAFADRGLRQQVEYWTDRAALEDRLAHPRALGRPITIERWEWASETEVRIPERQAA